MVADPIKAQSHELVGPISKEQIIQHDRIYEIYIERYQPDSTAVNYLSALTDTVELVVFIGSWCRESKKHIPPLMKTLELAKAKNLSVRYVAVNAQKNSPGKFLKKFNIKYIPTVVVLNTDNELGRIVEEPQMPIELELVEILRKAEKIE